MNSFDVIVVGVGAMGSATCQQLAARGARVLGLEQFDIPHPLGSSGGFSRLIRMAYYEHPDYVPLLRRAYELWAALESHSGQHLLHQTGGLYIGPHDGAVVCGSLASARRHGLRHEILSPAHVSRDFPQINLPDDWTVVYDPLAGFLPPEKVIAAYAGLALRQGAVLHGREAVVDWRADGAGVAVKTSRQTYTGGHLVFCSGAWSAKLLPMPLQVTRQTLGWVWPKEPELFTLGRFPVWTIDNPDGSIHYGFPMMPDMPGFKIAHHAPGQPTDPDRVDRQMQQGDEATFRPALGRFFPKADGPLLSLRTCLYANSPDHHFIIDRLPGQARVTVACGFSGHGFKFASVIGEILADLATAGTTALPVEFLRLSRLSPGA